MTCKDCIHYDICLDNGDDAAKQNAPNAEKECKDFKNKADFVNKAEIEELKADKEALINGQETLQKYIAKQKAEIERLESEVKICRDTLGEEINRANNHYNDSITYKTALDSVCKELKAAKQEAYKEIIAKLKKHLCSYDLPDYHYFRAVDEDVIDEVLEEMVGK